MSRSGIQEPWRSALERKGISSIRALASKAEISPMAASRLVKGEGTSVETINAVAWFVFDDDVEYVWHLRGLQVKDLGQFKLPDEAALLTEDQRSAILAVVRAMLPAEVRSSLAGTAIDQPTNVTQLRGAARDVGKGTRAQRDKGQNVDDDFEPR